MSRRVITWNSKASVDTSAIAFAGSAPYLPGSAAQAYRSVRNELKKKFADIPDVEFVMREPDPAAGENSGDVAVVLPDDRGVICVRIEWKSTSAFESFDKAQWQGESK